MRRPALTVILLALMAVGLIEGIVVYRMIQNANQAAHWASVEGTLSQETSTLARRVMADPYALHSHGHPNRRPTLEPVTSAGLQARQ
ncbi:MAG: hypothetical protein IT285_11225 [Bdellovibrionales bacterium]|nr:hypothetical protein [Bdellovibrionales bacterium]